MRVFSGKCCRPRHSEETGLNPKIFYESKISLLTAYIPDDILNAVEDTSGIVRIENIFTNPNFPS